MNISRRTKQLFGSALLAGGLLLAPAAGLAQDYPSQGYPAQEGSAQGYPGQDYPMQGGANQGYPTQGYPAQEGPKVAVAPPAIPVYTQPICPGEGYIWTPGYWA